MKTTPGWPPGWWSASKAMPGLLALVSAVVGTGLGSVFWQEEIAALDRLRDQVSALEGQLQPAAVQASPSARPAPVQPTPAEPDERESAHVWAWLQQRLRAHGMAVLALRPSALEAGQGLPVQRLVLELQGRWGDWLAFAHALDRHAPWWTTTQWQVAPAGATGQGQVKVVWHLRWGWRPAEAVAGSAQDILWPEWPVVPAAAGPDVFAGPADPAPVLAASMTEAPLPADPAQWPVQYLRLLGTWQQAGRAHAVLGNGLHLLVVVPGQRVGREKHRVLRIGEGEVLLQPVGPGASLVHLRLTGDSP